MPRTKEMAQKNANDRDAGENEAATTLSPVKEKKLAAKKRKQVVEEGDEVEAQKLEQPQKKQRKRKDLDFIIHCQANGLCEIVSRLNHSHEEDAKMVGFGGMLHIKGISATKTKLIRWLVERFNGRSQMLEIDDMNRFVVTADDICDVFLLPNGGLDVIRTEVKKNEPDRRGLLAEWEAKYGIKRTVSLTEMKKIIETKFADVGGPDFQRLFVLYSISSFLAPVSSQKMDWGLLECVADVGSITSYNWCKYVLDRMCKGVETFRASPGSKNISGCVLVLQILYFQRLKWKGLAEPCSLPLIRHWTTEKFNKRMQEEQSAGGWGKGEWVTSVYPISSENENDERTHVVGKRAEGVAIAQEEAEPVKPTKFVQFELMDGEMDDEEIRRVAQDDTHEAILLLKRDMDLVSRVNQERLFKLTQKMNEKDCGQSVPDMTESQKFYSSDQVISWCEQAEAQYVLMKKIASAIPMPSFELLTPETPRSNMDGETSGAIRMGEVTEAELQGDFWPVGENSDFKCLFMRKYMKSSGDMTRKEKDVVDYCLSHRAQSEKIEKPNVFAHCSKYFISFDDIATLNNGRSVSPAIVDAWALMLNKLGDGSCFYLSTQHSPDLHKLVNGVEVEVDFAEKVRVSWHDWVNNMQLGDSMNLGSFNFIFVPICIAEHFFAVVVNLVEQKVQNLDNITHSKKVKNGLYEKLQNAVRSQMAIFLHEKKHPKAENVEEYEVEDVLFAWKGCSGTNSDSGILLMNHMEFFRGHPYENPSLKNREDRIWLRARYCAKILLSDVNHMKKQLETDVLEFSESRRN